MKTFLGVDLGTSSVKTVLADGEGRILDSESEKYPLLLPQDGWSEQSPEDWYAAVLACLRRLGGRRDLKEVAGVSFSGQMHGLVVLDGEDRVIRPAILWNDNRTAEECAFLNETVGRDKLLEWTGNVAFTGFTAPKLMWLRKHEPENFARIAKIMLPKDYVAYMLSGVFASDVSDDSGTLYFDVKNRSWSKPMLDIIGITEAQLPAIYESTDVIGKVKPEFAAASGLNPDAKIVMGGGDQAVGAVGTGTVEEGTMFVSLGTSGVVFAPCAEFAASTNGGMHVFRHANGAFHFMGCMLNAAGSMQWWSESVTGKSVAELIDEVDASAANDLIFLPYLTGERSPINDPDAKGVFYGLNLSHKRADMTKSVIEGVCFGLKDCYDNIRKMGAEASYARVIGGGSKSDKWMQILADVLGLELRRINTSDGAGLGAVIIAMTGCGVFGSLKEACAKLIGDTDRFVPDPSAHARYEKKFAAFKEVYARLK